MSSGDGGLREVSPVAPGCGLVVEGAGLQAPVQDADEPVRQPPEGIVVLDSLGALLWCGTGPDSRDAREQWSLMDIVPMVREHFGVSPG